MIIEHHSIEVVCNNCLSTDEIDVSDMNFDITNNDDILKVIRPLGWMSIGGNISNLLCPTCAKNTRAIPQPEIGTKVYSLIDDRQRNLKTLKHYIVEDITHTQRENDKYYKAIYVKTENGGISVLFAGEYTLFPNNKNEV